MKALRIVVISIIILVFGIFIMQFLMSQKTLPQQKKTEIVKRYVNAIPANLKNVKAEIVSYGRLKSVQSIDLAGEVSGEIFKGSVPLKSGAKFKKGELLYKIDNTNSSLLLKAKKSRFISSIAKILAEIKINFPNNYSKWENYFNNLDEAKPLPEIPEADSFKMKTYLSIKNIYSDYYSILSDEETMDNYEKYAPYDGSFSEVYVSENTTVSPQTKIGKIIRTDIFEIELPIPVEDIMWLKNGTEIDIYTETGNTALEGKIKRISEIIYTQTHSVTVYAEIKNNSDIPLFEGEYMKAVVPGVEIDNVMEVDRSIIFQSDKVWVVVDNKLKERKVEVVKLNEKTAFIRGIKEGTMIVSESLPSAQENSEVQIIK